MEGILNWDSMRWNNIQKLFLNNCGILSAKEKKDSHQPEQDHDKRHKRVSRHKTQDLRWDLKSVSYLFHFNTNVIGQLIIRIVPSQIIYDSRFQLSRIYGTFDFV